MKERERGGDERERERERNRKRMKSYLFICLKTDLNGFFVFKVYETLHYASSKRINTLKVR